MKKYAENHNKYIKNEKSCLIMSDYKIITNVPAAISNEPINALGVNCS